MSTTTQTPKIFERTGVTLYIDDSKETVKEGIGFTDEEAKAFHSKVTTLAKRAVTEGDVTSANIIPDLTDKEATFLVVFGCKQMVDRSAKRALLDAFVKNM